MLRLSRASQNNKIPDVPRPIITQASNNTVLPAAANERSNINSLTFNSSTSNSSISSSSREANGIVEDLSSLTMQSNCEANVTSAVTSSASSNSDFTGTDTRRTGKHPDAIIVHKCPNDEGVSDCVVLERSGSDDSNNSTTKCQQQQNRSKENLASNKGHHQQSKSTGKKKSKDKKNTNFSHEKLKQSGGGGARNVVSDSTAANSEGRPPKENITKTGGNHGSARDTHNKKKKNNKDNVMPTAGADSHEVLLLAKSESNFVPEHRSSTSVKAPPPGLTKQPSHTNAVNGKSIDICKYCRTGMFGGEKVGGSNQNHSIYCSHG